MVDILMYVPDLMFGTRIEEGARHLGYTLESYHPAEEPGACIGRLGPRLLIVALDAPAWESLVGQTQRAGVPILAFGSHRNVKAMQAAKEAGCTEVLARSRIAAELPNLLDKYLKDPARKRPVR